MSSIGSLLGGGSSPAPMPMPAPAPSRVDDAEAQEAAARERKRAQRAASRNQDIKHGAGGLEEAAPVKKKYLLGG